MPVTTLVRADRLFFSTKFQSAEPARYYLSGVFLDICKAGGVKLVATDNYRMSIFRDAIGYTERPLIVSLPRVCRQAYAGLPKAQRENTWFGILDYPPEGHVARPLAAIWTTSAPGFIGADLFPKITEDMHDPQNMNVIWFGAVEIVDGFYPDYQRVVPATRPRVAEIPAYQIKYLKGFAEIAASSDSSSGCKIMGAGDGEAAYVDIGRDDFLGVIMPIRFDIRTIEERDGGFFAPAWVFDGTPTKPPRQDDENEDRASEPQPAETA